MKDIKEIIKQVRKIEISTKKLVDGLISGKYHSIFKGQGIEFSEIREYQPGDDVRAIDWNVTARFNKPFIKEFIEERDLRIYVVFDVSGSADFGNLKSKKRKAIELISTIMFAAIRNNDKVGLFLTTEEVEKYALARKGKKHVLKLISTLLSFEPKSKKTNLKKSLTEISRILKKKSVVIIVSDFCSEDFSKPLKMLKNKHDIIAINISDARESEFLDVGLINLEDSETGEQILVDTSDPQFIENYLKGAKSEEMKRRNLFKKLKIDEMQIKTDEEYAVPLKRFFNVRGKRC